MSVFYSDLQWLTQNHDLLCLKQNKHDLLTPNQTWLDSVSKFDLDQFMQTQNTHMLGTYYEALWAFYLNHHPSTQLIAQNIQINDKQRKMNPTVGEMDFIYLDRLTQHYVHLEVAIKFYLEVNPIDPNEPLSKWMGPKKNDRLDIKYHKLMDRQTKILDFACTQATIKPLIQNKPIRAAAALQGRLFHQFIDNADFESSFNKPNCQKHVWFTIDQFKIWFVQHHNAYNVQSIIKPHWLNLKMYSDYLKYPLLSLTQIIQKVMDHDYAQPFVVSTLQTQSIQRMIFIAPTTWLSPLVIKENV
ncbi:DUF1853 family protein [Marinicellulosiphila megalodicopiae]|uniref:DUF1853 family protein n=1 Tax=Marinicellulosiphila megalodicopiae TaxID=2724896 RepID=UPI003BAED39E